MRFDVIFFSAFAAGDLVPEWVHLAPVGTFKGRDGRGPYTLDAQAVLADFAAGDRRPIDENHAIDKAAPEGRPSPARGWIVALESRGDGIWGRVEWTDTGRQLLTDKAYRGISPALRVTAGGRVLGIARASLVNDPNLSLTSLHNRSADHMDLVKLREALGLAADASEAAILAALDAQKTAVSTHQAQVAAIAAALGLAAGATSDQVVTELQSRQGDAGKIVAVKTGLAAAGIDFDKVTAVQIETHLRAGGGGAEVATLRTTVTELQSQLVNLQNDTAKKAAVAFVDGQIGAGKMIRTLRDHYIDRHMKEPEAVEKELSALPSLHMGGRRAPPAGTQDSPALTDADREVCELMGLDQKAFAATKKTMTEVL